MSRPSNSTRPEFGASMPVMMPKEPIAVLLPLPSHHRRGADILHRLTGPLHRTDDCVNVGRDDGVEDGFRILRIFRALEHVDDHLEQRMLEGDRSRPMLAGILLIRLGEVLAGNSGQA